MRSRLPLAYALLAVVLFFAACSGPTVVVADNRAAEEDSGGDASSSQTASTETATASGSDADRGDVADVESNDAEADQSEDSLTPKQLEEAEGFGLGGAEQLASLQGDCESGNDMACDVLFQLSDFDSPQEAAALSCGGRADDSPAFCTAGIDVQPEQLVFDPESPGIDAIVSSCIDDGDMTACDFLYFRSPVASDLEEIGATCGDRVSVAVPDCRTFLSE